MGRVLQLAAAVVVFTTASAYAGGSTQHVLVETEPKGAVVYIDDVEKGPMCQPTPCSFDIAVGKYTLIVQKQNFTPAFENIDVQRRPKKPLVFKYSLDAASATIIVDNPQAKGASIVVDGTAKGKVDGSGNARVEVEPTGHSISVTLNGKTLFEEVVTLDNNQEYAIKISASAFAAKTPPKEVPKQTASTDEGGGDTTESGSSEGSASASVTTTAPAQRRDRYIEGNVVVDVGFRRFEYQNPQMGPLAPESEDGQVIAGPAVEVWPMVILDTTHLRGLSVFLKAEFPINHQDVKDSTMNTIATTYWSTFEASVRHRWTVADIAGIEVGAGYVRDLLRFNGDAGDVTKLPDADYQSLRIGARGSLVLGPIEPYISAENRVILDGGVLPKRFSTASGSGIRGALGFAAHGGNFTARLEASAVRYSWQFTNSSTGNFYQADGATDEVLGISFAVGYQY